MLKQVSSYRIHISEFVVWGWQTVCTLLALGLSFDGEEAFLKSYDLFGTIWVGGGQVLQGAAGRRTESQNTRQLDFHGLQDRQRG
jgi:hypothetical protein